MEAEMSKKPILYSNKQHPNKKHPIKLNPTKFDMFKKTSANQPYKRVPLNNLEKETYGNNHKSRMQRLYAEEKRRVSTNLETETGYPSIVFSNSEPSSQRVAALQEYFKKKPNTSPHSATFSSNQQLVVKSKLNSLRKLGTPGTNQTIVGDTAIKTSSTGKKYYDVDYTVALGNQSNESEIRESFT